MGFGLEKRSERGPWSRSKVRRALLLRCSGDALGAGRACPKCAAEAHCRNRQPRVSSLWRIAARGSTPLGSLRPATAIFTCTPCTLPYPCVSCSGGGPTARTPRPSPFGCSPARHGSVAQPPTPHFIIVPPCRARAPGVGTTGRTDGRPSVACEVYVDVGGCIAAAKGKEEGRTRERPGGERVHGRVHQLRLPLRVAW